MFLSGLSGDIPQVIEKLLESDEQQFFFALEIVICETAVALSLITGVFALAGVLPNSLT